MATIKREARDAVDPKLASIPDNFGGIGAEGELAPAEMIDGAPLASPEPDAEGYERPASIGPVGQVVVQGLVTIREPRSVHGYTAEQLGAQTLQAPDSQFAPLDRGVRCVNCGGVVGAFVRDRVTGQTRHQSCPPGRQRWQGVPRETPQATETRRHEFTVQDAKSGMKAPDDETRPGGDQPR